MNFAKLVMKHTAYAQRNTTKLSVVLDLVANYRKL